MNDESLHYCDLCDCSEIEDIINDPKADLRTFIKDGEGLWICNHCQEDGVISA